MATGNQSSLALFNEASMMDGEQQYVDGQPNDLLWKARNCLIGRHGDIDEALQLIRRIRSLNEQGRVGAWTMAETYWTDAEWYRISGREKMAHGSSNTGKRHFTVLASSLQQFWLLVVYKHSKRSTHEICMYRHARLMASGDFPN